MDEFLSVMGPALAASLLLTAIYVYFGIHIVHREVIFVDLALAQVAAMGSTVAFLLGFELDGRGAYFFSLCFAFLGAVIFALTRWREGAVPQEAIIGIVYAFAAAATVLLVDKAPHGAEHIKVLLVGNILWVSWWTIGQLSFVLVAVAFFHYKFRDRFFAISFDSERVEREHVPVAAWDLLFYLSLAWVVTSSVRVAGVLLIFSFLIVPAVCALLVSTGFRANLFVGWLIGAAACLLGSVASYNLDLPTGAAIVCTFGGVLLLLAALRRMLGRVWREPAA